MRSDTDCEGSSESDAQREQAVRKRAEQHTRPDGVLADRGGDVEELVQKLQGATLSDTGILVILFAAESDLSAVASLSNDSSRHKVLVRKLALIVLKEAAPQEASAQPYISEILFFPFLFTEKGEPLEEPTTPASNGEILQKTAKVSLPDISLFCCVMLIFLTRCFPSEPWKQLSST